jgi:hypothetical protein
VSWSLRFADGGKLSTLREPSPISAGHPKSDHEMPGRPEGAELLTNAAEHGGPVEFARIAPLQAIDRHPHPPPLPIRADTGSARGDRNNPIIPEIGHGSPIVPAYARGTYFPGDIGIAKSA